MPVANDPITDDQSETGPGADRFGGEKRLEHARLDLRRNAGAIVDNFNDNLIVFK